MQILSETFFIMRRTERDMIKIYIGLHVKYRLFYIYIGLHVKYPLFLPDLKET